ncbi:transcriptional regulator [Paenibacillus sp. J45TS6]|uniref:Winged helix-turn-helix transcriptional regulator n=1 Tax=Paenibacillus gallinarum TaxID=2762232 RepID=A0ABR8T647_9BACL|nr:MULTISPECIES: metalloregulator ArsR/SmtB family transcription factor [Paenibacillus]MBD7971070.1 winged helix-turn-helix transcriptional regulator [Paenibacillus gallinarum]GIP44060.1 transcriptional regulator [Paenibacillus sp. J45TS6]
MKDSCEIYCYDETRVRKVQHALQQQNIQIMSKMFKALADETRLKIVFSLCEEELCVCDVANITGSSLATASHHLRILKQLGLAKYRKEGKLVFYSLEDDHVRQLVQLASMHTRS